jgi:hypothetical protein
VLLEALAVAKSTATLPIAWLSYTRTVFGLASKTWTPALGTLLLAKAVCEDADALSLKAEPSDPRAYSARGLCHAVLVPAAVQHGFSIRNTGREPLNNQPFFRYDRIDKIERVKKPEDLRLFVDIAEQANKLTSTDAVEALAAFLREALAKAAETRNISARSGGLSPDGARVAVEEFIRYDAVDRPQRLQAFAAACFGLVYDEVKTRRLNDPSRDVPGDVQVLSGGTTVIAVEVRGKPVTAAELGTFVAACRDAGLSRAIMFVDAPKQTDLTSHASVLGKVQPAVHAAVFGSVSQLLADSILWSPLPLDEAVQKFTSSFLARLVEIEATTQTLQEWSRTVAVARAR